MKLKRAYYIFKCRIQVLINRLIERVLKTLSNLGFIVEHKTSYVNIINRGDITPVPEIKSDRYIFDVSYIIHKFEFVSEYWFCTKKGKRIYTVCDSHHFEFRISYRAELKSFLAHFSHKCKVWVHKHSPRVALIKPNAFEDLTGDVTSDMKIEEHYCDFSQCRYGFEFSLSPDAFSDTDVESKEEALSESYRILKNDLEGKISDINELLTGVKNDGDITSPSGAPLSDNLLCRKCGYPVFASIKDKYSFECVHHGDISNLDVIRVDPARYKEVLNNCLPSLEQFCGI